MTLPAHRQSDHRVRFDWGRMGADAITPGADLVVVVDVLSFTTSVEIAVAQGVQVLPYRWADDSAASFATANGALLAVGRSVGRDKGLPSLSPASLRELAAIDRLVLPSPNGSTISLGLAEQGVPVVAGCLRNASAVGRYAATVVEQGGAVAVIAGGERWPDGSLRPAVEDLWGAGAILAAVAAPDLASVEARVAQAAYLAVAPNIASALTACASGRELIDAGFADDVAIAAAFDASEVVPLLTDGAFRPA